MLCVVGMPGCGKSIFVAAASKAGFGVIVMGDAVREETTRRGLPLEMHGTIAKKLREEMGESAVAQLVCPRIQKPTRTIIDGVRGWSEVEEFRKHHDLIIVGIVCPTRIRFKRLGARGREGDPATWEEFVERDVRELGFGLGHVLARADYYLVNDGTLEEFQAACERFFAGTGCTRIGV